MKVLEIEKFLLKLPGATLSIQWGNDRVFKVGGKMFAVIGVLADKSPGGLSFKAGDDGFHILIELPGIKPAPYLSRAQWVWLDRPSRLKPVELKAYLTRAHSLVAAGLTKKAQRALGLIA